MCIVNSCPGVNNSTLCLCLICIVWVPNKCQLRSNSHEGAFQTFVSKEWSKQAGGGCRPNYHHSHHPHHPRHHLQYTQCTSQYVAAPSRNKVKRALLLCISIENNVIPRKTLVNLFAIWRQIRSSFSNMFDHKAIKVPSAIRISLLPKFWLAILIE